MASADFSKFTAKSFARQLKEVQNKLQVKSSLGSFCNVTQ